tara:strand:+ start:45 stop:710 length:666 start_codon:yes stop_codon:yes gene_type:complete
MSIFDYNYEKFLEEGAKENVGLATLNQLNKFQKEYFKPRFGPFNLGDAIGILKNNPYSMSLTGITAALNPKIFGAKGNLSTRGIGGLNSEDVFNIETAERIAKELGLDSGEDPAKDPYGINIVSARGNYKDYVTQKARELAKMKFKTDSANQRKDFYEEAFKKIQEQQRARQKNQAARDAARVSIAYQDETGGQGGSYATGESGVQADGSYNDPFDPGGGE